MMKKVKVFKQEAIKKVPNGPYYRRLFDYEALFCQWGLDYEQFDNGAVNFTVAVVKCSDGTIKTPEANLIQFIE